MAFQQYLNRLRTEFALRWRPPSPRSSPYITPRGYAALEREVASLWERRAETTAAITAAAAEGDRSENAEYIYRKKELRELDRRIRYLQKRMPDLTVVRAVGNRDQVFFGACVTLECEDGERVRYHIVGADELDPAAGTISIDSPLAKALLKKAVGDEVELSLGESRRYYCVDRIDYEPD